VTTILSLPSLRRAVGVLVIATAADALAIDSEERLQPRAPDRPLYLPPKPVRAPFQLPPLETPFPTELPTTGSVILLRQVLFHGNTVVSTEELEQVAAPYVGKNLKDLEIEELRRKLTQYYVDRGYVNSGALLDKGIADKEGVLTFKIVEGKVSRVEIRGLERLRDEYVTARLVPRPEEPLNLNTLRNRFQLLLDDPLFARINARLMPDVNAGDAILDLDAVRARPYQLTVFANNYRPPSIGANAIGLRGNVRNLTTYGDLLDFSYQEPTRGHAANQYLLGWRVPVNRFGTAVSLRFEHGQSVVLEAPLNALNITSQLDSRDLGISHPILESLRHKLSLGINSVDLSVKSRLLGEGFSFTPGVPQGRTKAHVWRLWQEYAHRTEVSALVLRSTFSRNANNNEQTSASSSTQPPPRYGYWLGQFQYAQRIGDGGTEAVLKGAIQRAATRMLPVDSISIGGVNTVRGYRENQLIRDNGQLFGLQVDFPILPGAISRPRIVVSPFFDWGRGSNVGDRPDTISSWGMAVRTTWQGFRFDLSAAKRLIHPSTVSSSTGSLQDKGVHLQLSYDVF
jgi:hemolysin activation/secretion protein